MPWGSTCDNFIAASSSSSPCLVGVVDVSFDVISDVVLGEELAEVVIILGLLSLEFIDDGDADRLENDSGLDSIARSNLLPNPISRT